MLEELENHYEAALADLENTTDSDALHGWHIKYLGKKGLVTLMLRNTGQLPKEERANFGKRANEIRICSSKRTPKAKSRFSSTNWRTTLKRARSTSRCRAARAPPVACTR